LFNISFVDSQPNRVEFQFIHPAYVPSFSGGGYDSFQFPSIAEKSSDAAFPGLWPPIEYQTDQIQSPVNDESLASEIALAYSRLGDLLFLQQQSNSRELVCPIPAAPMSAYSCNEWVQTEMFGGEIEGMGNRLLLYRNRIKVLEEKSELEQCKREALESGVCRMRETLKEDEMCMQLRKDNQILKESNQLQDVKLKDMERLINYYIEEVKSLEQRLGLGN
jgi:hypothetical protein